MPVADTVIVELRAKLDKYNSDVARASQNFEKGMDRISKSSLRAEAQALRSSTAISRAFSTVGGALLIREVQQMADAWTDYSSRVGLAIKNMDAAPQVMERIYDMAQRTYSALDQTAESFIQNSSTLRELGKSTKEQLDYTEALNNALVVSGAKAQVAASVQDALAKAMAAGALKGDNLNTVIERGGRVAEVIAEELGVSTLQLRKMGKEGKITGDVIYSSLTKRLGQLTAEAESMPATISDGFQRMRNALQRWIGTMDQATGLSGAIAQGMVYVSEKFDSVAHAAAAAGAILVSRYVPALARVVASQLAVVATNPFLALVTAISAATFAMSAFGGEFQPIADDMANLHDYAGAAFDAIKEGVIGAYDVISDSLLVAINLITDALSGVEVSWGDVWDVVKGAANSIIGAMGLVYDTVVISFTKLPSAIADGVISAMNAMIGFVESGINKVVSAVNTAIKAINSLGEWAGAGSLISEIGGVDLGRLGNEYAGAGEAAGEAFSAAFAKASQDHLGNLGEAWRNAANERARKRAEEENSGDGGGGGGGSGRGSGSGGSGKKGRLSEYEREIRQIKERTALLNEETAAQAKLNPLINDYEYAITKAKATQELLNAAKRAGLKDTPELRAQIEQLAEAYAQATVASNKLAESQEQARQASEFLRDAMFDSFKELVPAIETGNKALDKFLNTLLDAVTQAALLGKGPLAGLFGGAGRGLLGAIFPFAQGGIAAGGRPQPMKTFARGGVSRTAAIFGEAGPEAAVPLPDGRRIPVDLNVGGRAPKGDTTINMPIQINAPGADAAALARVEASVKDLGRNIPKMVDQRVNTRQTRNTRP